MIELKIRKFGNSLGVILPKDVLARLRSAEGERLYLVEEPRGEYRLTPYDPDFATKIVHGVGHGEPGFEEALADIRKGADVWGLAAVYAAQSVIKPQDTRDYLIRMLDVYKLRMTKGVGQHLMRSWPTSY